MNTFRDYNTFNAMQYGEPCHVEITSITDEKRRMFQHSHKEQVNVYAAYGQTTIPCVVADMSYDEFYDVTHVWLKPTA